MLSDKEQALVDEWLKNNKVTICKPSTCYIPTINTLPLLATTTSITVVKTAIPKDISIFDKEKAENAY